MTAVIIMIAIYVTSAVLSYLIRRADLIQCGGHADLWDVVFVVLPVINTAYVMAGCSDWLEGKDLASKFFRLNRGREDTK